MRTIASYELEALANLVLERAKTDKLLNELAVAILAKLQKEKGNDPTS